jgi:hypothetical protein
MKLKSNVVTIKSALQKVLAMRGVTYQMKSELADPAAYEESTARTYMGVIAQEVEAVAPELVRDTPNGIKAVAYQNMVGLLIEAMKEQNQKIDSLKEQLNVCCTAKTSSPTNERLFMPQGNNGGAISSTAYLAQNRPNPFSQTTSINYYVPSENNEAAILVFDMNGKLLKTFGIAAKGEGNLVIDAKQLQAGMYLYTLLIDGKEVDTKRMILTEK